MSEKNKELVKKINQSFLKGNAEEVSEYIDENIKWNIVGMPVINGKNNFIETMEMMELENFRDIKIKNIIAEGDFVVVESKDINSADRKEMSSVKPYTPSYCDVYNIKDGKIQELTTYMVDVTLNKES